MCAPDTFQGIFSAVTTLTSPEEDPPESKRQYPLIEISIHIDGVPYVGLLDCGCTRSSLNTGVYTKGSTTALSRSMKFTFADGSTATVSKGKHAELSVAGSSLPAIRGR